VPKKNRRPEGFARVTLKNISRAEPKFFGWKVHVKRRGHNHVQYFADGTDGPFESLRAALEWRDATWQQLGHPSHVSTRHSRNTSGIIGVRIEVTPGGTEHYVAKWLDADRKRHGRAFSIDKYGRDEARRMAIAARAAGVAATKKERDRRLLETLHVHETLLRPRRR
jgi:hypothetical protein